MVTKTRYLVLHESCSVNVDWIRVYVVQRKNGIMMNVGMSAKN